MPALASSSTRNATRTSLRKYLAAFRNHGYWPFRVCFEATAREVGSRGADIWVRVQVDAKGSIAQTRALATNVDRRSITNCVTDAARSIKLPLAIGNRSTFVLRVRLFPGDAPLASLKSLDDTQGLIDPKTLGSEVSTLRKAIEDCAVLGVRRNPQLWGRISLQMKVAKDGQIVDFKEAESRFPDKTVIECSRTAALNAMLSWRPNAGVLQLALRVGKIPNTEGDASNAARSPRSPQIGK